MREWSLKEWTELKRYLSICPTSCSRKQSLLDQGPPVHLLSETTAHRDAPYMLGQSRCWKALLDVLCLPSNNIIAPHNNTSDNHLPVWQYPAVMVAYPEGWASQLPSVSCKRYWHSKRIISRRCSTLLYKDKSACSQLVSVCTLEAINSWPDGDQRKFKFDFREASNFLSSCHFVLFLSSDFKYWNPRFTHSQPQPSVIYLQVRIVVFLSPFTSRLSQVTVALYFSGQCMHVLYLIICERLILSIWMLQHVLWINSDWWMLISGVNRVTFTITSSKCKKKIAEAFKVLSLIWLVPLSQKSI